MQKFTLGLFVGLGAGVAATLMIVLVNNVTLARALSSQSPKETPAPSAKAVLPAGQVVNRDPHAAENARLNSIASTLQTLRGQIELFKIQHADVPPAAGSLAEVLCGKTNTNDTSHVNSTGTYGPYVQRMPENPGNGKSAVGAVPSKDTGWVYRVNGGQYTVEAVNTTGNGVLTY